MLTRLTLYDTKNRKNLEVQDQGGVVNIYCCGPTVYRAAHVGNFRTFLLADLIRKTLELNGLEVILVQNITDVGHMSEDVNQEDKILSQSAREKMDPFSLARKYELIFHEDLALLNIAKAQMYPRASECIAHGSNCGAHHIANGCLELGASQWAVYQPGSVFGNSGCCRIEQRQPEGSELIADPGIG